MLSIPASMGLISTDMTCMSRWVELKSNAVEMEKGRLMQLQLVSYPNRNERTERTEQCPLNNNRNGSFSVTPKMPPASGDDSRPDVDN